MKCRNKVLLLGNVGADPEIRYSGDGAAVANVSLATSREWTDKNTGEARKETEWHRVVMFRRLAEIVAQYVHKGDRLDIEGFLRTRKWQDQGGVDRYSTEIVALDMIMLSGAPAGAAGQGAPQPRQGGQAPAARGPGTGPPYQPQGGPPPAHGGQARGPGTGARPPAQGQPPAQRQAEPDPNTGWDPGAGTFDDDIPF